MSAHKQLPQLIRMALQEDIGPGDRTTNLLIQKKCTINASIVSRESGIVCGIDVVRKIFVSIDKRVTVRSQKHDGNTVRRGNTIMQIRGPARSVLKGERLALNFLGHLSGISTLTHRFVNRIKGTRTRIYDTRKTTPGYRELEKYAVRMGGGCNHRWGLYDQILVKDNHWCILGKKRSYDLGTLIIRMRKKIPRSMKIEIEADSLSVLKKVIPLHPDIILLDNMKRTTLQKALYLIRKENRSVKRPILTEASGGITLRTVRSIALLGVDRISIGALTHSAHAIDFSFEIK